VDNHCEDLCGHVPDCVCGAPGDGYSVLFDLTPGTVCSSPKSVAHDRELRVVETMLDGFDRPGCGESRRVFSAHGGSGGRQPLEPRRDRAECRLDTQDLLTCDRAAIRSIVIRPRRSPNHIGMICHFTQNEMKKRLR